MELGASAAIFVEHPNKKMHWFHHKKHTDEGQALGVEKPQDRRVWASDDFEEESCYTVVGKETLV